MKKIITQSNFKIISSTYKNKIEELKRTNDIDAKKKIEDEKINYWNKVVALEKETNFANFKEINTYRKIKIKYTNKNFEINKDNKLLKFEQKFNKTQQIDKINNEASVLTQKVIFNSFKIFIINIYFKIINLFYKKKNKIVNYKYNKLLEKQILFTNTMAGETFWKKFTRKSIQGTFLFFMAVIIIFPFYWMILTSVRGLDEFDPLSPTSFFPNSLTWDAYEKLFEYVGGSSSMFKVTMQRFFINSILISFATTILQLLVSVVAGFGLANWKTKPQGVILIVMFATVMVPGEAMIIGQYIYIVQLGLKNTFWSLVVPFISNVFSIYLMANAFSNVGRSVKSAAKVDGLSTFKYFWKVALPSVRSTIVTSFIISLISSWNAVLWPTMVLGSNSEWVTLPMLLWNLMSVQGGIPGDLLENYARDPQNLKMAGAVASILPMIIIFVFANKLIIKGISRDRGDKG
ncbi:sugar ABC transporter permease [Spiroplasma helicoides]|uniref:Sugar ABC transporter permease n=1 Tax=Spiroplasma helicoides TaxID=216938 RepID=A0A1B3SLT0_9MOLU|nr:carbohydrate ABC transporter permease [Spiroplasma helicoides]AOG60860.1 sugar ABC transporter permease [Spiroplasma helicoides]